MSDTPIPASSPTPDPSPLTPLPQGERGTDADFIPRILSRARLQTDKVSGKPVLVCPETVLVLNPTGAEILALCDGVRTIRQIAAELATRYHASADAIAVSVADYLEKLKERNLVGW